VSSSGLSSISVAGHEVAHGEWRLTSGDARYGLGSRKIVIPDDGSSSLQIIDASHARVIQVAGDYRVTFDYSFSGEDIDIRARVENHSETNDLDAVNFEGLKFSFDQAPVGLMKGWALPDLQRLAIDAFYPSRMNPIGGSYAVGRAFGVGLSPLGPRIGRTLFLWTDPAPAQQVQGSSLRWLSFASADPVLAEGARTYAFRMRISQDTSWQHLLEPYRDQFTALAGPLAYHPDSRPIARLAIPSAAEDVTATNPYGYSDPRLRMDLTAAVQNLASSVAAVTARSGAQGLLVSGLAGYDTRRLRYEPDISLLPPSVSQCVPLLTQRFSAADLRIGVAGSPQLLDYQLDRDTSETVRMSPDDPEQVALLWDDRLKPWIDRGAQLFLFQGFGSSLGDIQLLRALRQKLGPDVQLLCDAPVDLTFVDAAGFGITRPVWGEYRLGFGVDIWQICQWLVPGAVMFSEPAISAAGPLPAEPACEFLAHNHLALVASWASIVDDARQMREFQPGGPGQTANAAGGLALPPAGDKP
jgi:hypothetical protein